jgi:prophage regulatory protein
LTAVEDSAIQKVPEQLAEMEKSKDSFSRPECFMAQPHFLLPSEVTALTRLRDPTRFRMEGRGLFPKRIRISPRRVGWRRIDVEAWIADPEGWPQRQASFVPEIAQPLPVEHKPSWRERLGGQGGT